MSEEEKKQKILDMWDKESLANEWVKEHIKYNYTKEDLDQAQEIIIELQQRIDKAIEYIKEYGRDKQLEEEYLMNAYNLAMYNITLLEILGDEDE